MKINAIGALCKKAKEIRVYNEEGRQRIGTSAAVYLMPESIGPFSESGFYCMLDIQPGKAAEFNYTESDFPEGYDGGDDAEEEELSYDSDFRCMLNAKDLLPCATAKGEVYMIQYKYLKPVSDSENLRLTLRIDSEFPYIAVKDGMFLTALIMPVIVREKDINMLRGLAAGIEQAGLKGDAYVL